MEIIHNDFLRQLVSVQSLDQPSSAEHFDQSLCSVPVITFTPSQHSNGLSYKIVENDFYSNIFSFHQTVKIIQIF